MKKVIEILLSIACYIASVFVTIEGLTLIIEKFTSNIVPFWGVFWLGVGYRFLVYDLLIVRKKIKTTEDAMSHSGVSLAFDIIAVYVVIPHALSYF